MNESSDIRFSQTKPPLNLKKSISVSHPKRKLSSPSNKEVWTIEDLVEKYASSNTKSPEQEQTPSINSIKKSPSISKVIKTISESEKLQIAFERV